MIELPAGRAGVLPIGSDVGVHSRPAWKTSLKYCRERRRRWRGRGTMKSICALIATTAVFFSSGANAQYSDGVVRIGVLTDMSSLYSDITGPGSVVAAKLAVEDFDPGTKGMKVEIITADHQNKTDIGSSIANSWFDVDKVDMIVDVPNSAVALAVSEVSRLKNKVFLEPIQELVESDESVVIPW
jgi:ABC-type branched-subunit amino acid transport system substrate-binding protein